MAVDWVIGNVGCPGEQSNLAKIERVIIAGDSLSTSTRGKHDQVKAKYLTANQAAGSIAAVRQLDDLLVQLGKLSTSVQTNLYFGPNQISNIICLSNIDRIE